MTRPTGCYSSPPPRQRYLADLAHLAHQVPTTSVQRTFRLAAVAAARQAAGPRPGWQALFTKALAFVAAAHPETRQLYHTFPRPRLYEHPITVAAVAVTRPLDDEMPFLWARLRSPEQLGLIELDNLLRRFKEEPGDKLGQVRRIRSRTGRPQWARRLAWWRDARLSGARHARRLGTVAVASVGQNGANLVDPLYPSTAVLTYGSISADGTVDVRLKVDARLLTAPLAAAILQDVERVLSCEILMELRYFQQIDAA